VDSPFEPEQKPEQSAGTDGNGVGKGLAWVFDMGNRPAILVTPLLGAVGLSPAGIAIALHVRGPSPVDKNHCFFNLSFFQCLHMLEELILLGLEELWHSDADNIRFN
jgi:hypothetical protein